MTGYYVPDAVLSARHVLSHCICLMALFIQGTGASGDTKKRRYGGVGTRTLNLQGLFFTPAPCGLLAPLSSNSIAFDWKLVF